MSTFSRSLSAALLSSSLLVAGAGLASAETLTGHEVIDQVNTMNGTKAVYGPNTYNISAIGPHDVSNQALNQEGYLNFGAHSEQAVSTIGPQDVSEAALRANSYRAPASAPADQLASR